MIDLFSARNQLRSSPTVDTLRHLCEVEAIDCSDRSFIKIALQDLAFHNNGKLDDFIDALRETRFGRNTDLDLEKIALQAKREALFVLRSHDDEALRFRAWDKLTVPAADINLEMNENRIDRAGVHLFNFCLGMGKTEKILIPLLRKYRGTATRVLLLTPNEATAKDIAKRAEVAHYHTYGKSPEDKRLAWQQHSQMTMCLDSYAGLSSDPNFIPPSIILWDEITEGLERVRNDLPKSKAESEHGHESLKALFRFAPFYKKLYAASADCPTGFVHNTLYDLAQIMNTEAHYYKTDESHLKGKIYTKFETKEDLVLSTIRKAKAGQAGWIFTDQSDSRDDKPNFSSFVNVFKKHAPELKIEAIDRRVMNSAKGRAIKEMGLANYAKYCRKELGVDLFIVSPIARSQISVVFGEDEIDHCFDFTAVFSDYIDICSPWTLRNASNRARQTMVIDYWINERSKHITPITKNEWKKDFPKEPIFDKATPAEKLYWKTLNRYAQYKRANEANRNWLFEELLKEKGAELRVADIEISESERDLYAKIFLQVKKESKTLAVDRYENNQTRKIEMVNGCYEFNKIEKEWRPLDHRTDLNDGIRSAAKIDGRAAERLYIVMTSDREMRKEIDAGSSIAMFEDTGEILDPLINEIIFLSLSQKQLPFPEWYLHGDDCFWLPMENLNLRHLPPLIKDNFEIIRTTICPSTTFGATVLGVLKMVGNELGMIVENKPRKKNKLQWRDDLFNELSKAYPGKLRKTMKWEQRWEVMQNILLEKLSKGRFQPTDLECSLLDDMPGVVRFEKKQFVNRGVIEVFRHWLLIVREQQRIEELENDIAYG